MELLITINRVTANTRAKLAQSYIAKPNNAQTSSAIAPTTTNPNTSNSRYGIRSGYSSGSSGGDLVSSSRKLHSTNAISDEEQQHKRRMVNEANQTNKRPRGSFSTARSLHDEQNGHLPPRHGDENSSKASQHESLLQTLSNPHRSKGKDLPSELASYDKALVEKIEADIIDRGQAISFDDISGLDYAKQAVIELICWPMKNPHVFTGLREPPRGLLLFGPPGTGKTLIGKAIAHESGATFFSISASSLMSKFIGEGEKTVRTLFAVAAYRAPAVIFIDEVDSLLCQRNAEENEASRRMKTEFMVQLDGAHNLLPRDGNKKVIIIGATNRPEELDEAVRRRFVKRLYIPLPDSASRRILVNKLLGNCQHTLLSVDIENLVERTEGFSGADLRALCTEAAMGPIREVASHCRGDLGYISNMHDIPPINSQHFLQAFDAVAPSVSPTDLQRYIDWNHLYGSYKRSIC